MIKISTQLAMRFEILTMAIPPGARHFDEWHTRLDQSPSDQTLFTKLCRTVMIAHLLWFVFNVEEIITRHQSPDTLKRRIVTRNGGALPVTCELFRKHLTE